MAATVGARIKQLRERRGLSQAGLVAGLPMSSSYVSLIETGQRQPQQRVLELLARRLGCTVEYLRTGSGGEFSGDLELELRFAEVALRSGDPAAARQRFDQAYGWARQLGYDDLCHQALWGRSRADEALGAMEAAIEGFLALAEQPELTVSRVAVLTALSRAYRVCGDLARAVEVGESALKEAGVSGGAPLDGDETAELASTLVSTYYERGDLTQAHILITKVIAGSEQAGSPRARAAAYWSAGLVADARGDLRSARAYTERALALYSESDNARAVALLRKNLAWVILRTPGGDYAQARELLHRSMAALPEVGSPVDVAAAETELARCELLTGSPAAAAEFARSALARLAPGPRVESARARTVLGDAQLAEGDVDAAAASYRTAAEELDRIGAHRQAAEVWCELAEAMAHLGLADAAIHAFRQATLAGGIVSRPHAARYVSAAPAARTGTAVAAAARPRP